MVKKFSKEIKKIFVVNEKSLTERRRNFEKQFNRYDCKLTFIDNWSPSEIDEKTENFFF